MNHIISTKFISMKFILFVFATLFFLPSIAQDIEKKNLSKKVNFYYDKNNIKLQSSGYYYQDELGETTMKHGRWRYYDRQGALEEERHYYRDMLYGKTLVYYTNKKLRREGYFKYNTQDSIFREWNENGNLAVEGNYSMGQTQGLWKYYYIDGRLKSSEEVIDSLSYVREFFLPDSLHTQTVVEGNGELLVYYQTGRLKEYYQYQDGLKHGKFEEYSIYGYPLLTGEFKNGLQQGKWTYGFYTGQTEKICNYDDGELSGEYTQFYDNKEVKVQGVYSAGQKSGKWQWFTNEGKLDMEGEFKNDLQDGNWTYNYPEGLLSYTAQFKEGKRDGEWKYFYKNGKPFKKGSYLKDKKNGLWETWYENEVLLMTGVYKNGKEEGEWKNYWENGELKNKSTFKAGLLDGKWESYHQNRVLSLSGTYSNNFKVDEWIVYSDKGFPLEIKNYELFKEKSKINYSILKGYEREDSRLDGKYVAYSQKDFKLTETGSYNNGEKDGEWIAYHNGGKMQAVVSNYKNGNSTAFRRNSISEVESSLQSNTRTVYAMECTILMTQKAR
jgi:antitoxin component YwqK of YwqJK toxin-antitoxin module